MVSFARVIPTAAQIAATLLSRALVAIRNVSAPGAMAEAMKAVVKSK
jgi:hypothetical protein